MDPLACMTQLTRLEIPTFAYGEEETSVLGNALRACTSLMHFQMLYSGPQTSMHVAPSRLYVGQVYDALAHLHKLTYLDLGSCVVGEESMGPLVDTLGSNRELQHLRLCVECHACGAPRCSSDPRPGFPQHHT